MLGADELFGRLLSLCLVIFWNQNRSSTCGEIQQWKQMEIWDSFSNKGVPVRENWNMCLPLVILPIWWDLECRRRPMASSQVHGVLGPRPEDPEKKAQCQPQISNLKLEKWTSRSVKNCKILWHLTPTISSLFLSLSILGSQF